MDFYTLKTSVDLTEEPTRDAVLAHIGFFTQPLLVGESHIDSGSFVLRFAVRRECLRAWEQDLLVNLQRTPWGFTEENTELIRAARI